MEHRLRLNNAGQTSVEFLFLFLIMLFYLQVVIQPKVEESSAAIIAVNKVGQAKLNAMKLANSINEVNALSGESSKTIWLFMENCTSVWCDEPGKKIEYKAFTGTNLGGLDCTGTVYTGEIKLLDDVSLSCSGKLAVPESQLPPKAEVKVSKQAGVVSVWMP